MRSRQNENANLDILGLMNWVHVQNNQIEKVKCNITEYIKIDDRACLLISTFVCCISGLDIHASKENDEKFI